MALRVLVSITLSASAALCQSSYGRLTGRVTDPQAAVVSGARVHLVQSGTNIATQGATNADGLYDIPNLLPGTYTVEVSLEGFRKYTRSGVIVRVGDVLGLDVALEVGSISESVSVTGEAPLLETTTASSGQVIDNKQLSDLPLSGRGVNYLMQLSPTVAATNAPMHGWLPQARDSVSNIAVAGVRTRASEFTLDGIPNMAREGIIAFQPPPEMIQEFRVQTAAYDAALGRFAGANVNMVLKSGANDYHGALWFSHLSRPLMTHPFFVNRNLWDTRSGEPNADKRSRLWPATRTNRYRGQIGGPVRIPKLYDGKNRTFFSYGNDFMLRIFANLSTQTVPLADQRNGDFSQLLRLGGQYQIYDPSSIAAAADGRFSRQPLPGNIVPASRISPLAKRLLDYYPLPNATGTADGRQNFFGTAASRIDYWSHMTRVDQVVNDRHRFYVSFSLMRTDGDQGRNLVNDAIGNISVNKYYSASFDHVWTVSPSLIANFRYGAVRNSARGGSPTSGMDLSTLGFGPSLTRGLDRSLTALPTVNIDTLAAIGTNLPSRTALNTHYVYGSLSKSAGTHTLRMGAEYRALFDNSYDYGNYSGSYTFGNLWTRGPFDTSGAAPTGQGTAAFLLGLPTDGFIDVNDSKAEKSGYWGFYFQDDWKATRKLSLNIGLRYELEQPSTERYNRANRGLDYDVVNPADAAVRAAYARNPIPDIAPDQFRLRGGVLFAGIDGQPRGMWNPDRNNFAPRIGLAYTATPTTVVRAGYGIFVEPLGTDRSDVDQLGYSQRTRLNPSSDNGLTFRGTLQNPYPDGVLAAPKASGGLLTYLGLSPGLFYTGRRNGYMQRWSFNIQKQIGPNWLAEIGYTGNRGNKLSLTRDFNAIPQQYLSTASERDQTTINALTRNVPNPFRGIAAFSNSPAFFNNVNVARSQLLRPRPQFGSLVSALSEGFSWYHAGHVRLERRFRGGYSISGHYTWSKFMEAIDLLNAADVQPHHVISPQDRPHHLAISSLWDLPVGRGRKWMSKMPRAADYAIGGWSINTIYQWQSGPPIGFGNVIYRGTLQDLVIPYADRAVEKWFNTANFETRGGVQLDSNIRRFPLRLTGLRADGWNNWDLALFKEIPFTERVKLQLRAEAVDALNHAMFNPPVVDPVNTAFGQVNATIWTEQRKITVAAKLTW